VAATLPYLADALVVLGVLVMTIGVYGILHMPDVYNKLHAASKVVFLGILSLCTASMVTGDSAIIFRVILISVFLILTTPVAANTVGRAAYLREVPMRQPGAVDESGGGLDEDGRQQ